MSTSSNQTPTQRLQSCESVIEKGLKTFIEVGEALLEIRETKLYLAVYSTFDAYCQERWGMSIRQSQRYISAARVVNNLKEGDPWVVLPTSERQVRALGSLQPAEQQQVWQAAIQDDEPITGEAIAAKVQFFKQNQISPAVEEFAQSSKDLSIHFTSDSYEWYTPPEIITATLKVLKTIDLDPCSNCDSNPNIPAKQCFTKTTNGLNQPWRGTVYMNPPYGREIKEWIAKLHDHYQTGMVTEAVVLTPARTDTQWFYLLREFPRCFIKGRLTFSAVENTAPFPSVVFYLGKNAITFKQYFQNLGDIYQLL